MPVQVKVPTILRPQVGGAKSVDATGATIDEVLTDLDSRHPGIRGRIVADDGNLHRFVNLYVNDEDIRFLGSLQAPVNEGDTVTILPAVAGG